MKKGGQERMHSPMKFESKAVMKYLDYAVRVLISDTIYRHSSEILVGSFYLSKQPSQKEPPSNLHCKRNRLVPFVLIIPLSYLKH